jgi:hypothetical protein
MAVGGLHSLGSGNGKFGGCYERLGFIKSTEFLASLNNHQLFYGGGYPQFMGLVDLAAQLSRDKDGRSLSETRLGKNRLNLRSNKGKWTKPQN